MLEMYELQALAAWASLALVAIGLGLVWLWRVFLKALRNEGLWDDADHGEGEED